MEKIGFAFYLSLKIAIIATGIVFVSGMGLSWVLARINFSGKKLARVLINLPLVIPPSVLGYYLLLIFGRRGTIGRLLEDFFGIRVVFHWIGGVIAAVIVSLPLFINSVLPVLSSLPEEVEQAAKVDGASGLQIFYKIILPLIRKGLIAGTALTFARSLGEFGTSLMLMGNIPGKTQTMSLAIYQAVLSGQYGVANKIVLTMTFIAMVIMFIVGQVDDLE